MWLLFTEVADSTALRSSARGTERAGARSEPYDRSSAKVGERTDPRMQGQDTLAGNGIVMVRAGGTARVEGWITHRLRVKARAAAEGVTILSLF